MTDKPDIPSTLHRLPSRKRGVQRFEALLDAAASVLGERPDDDISLAQIAERAGVPLASVYHFFPNRNAALVALAQRFHRQIYALPTYDKSPPAKRWQDIIERRLRASASYLNANPAALRLFMGAGVSVEVRNADITGNAAIARLRTQYLHERFVLPAMPDLEKRFAISLAMIDGIWALSYSAHRRITDEYLDESIRATIVYLRSYLPEILEPRLS